MGNHQFKQNKADEYYTKENAILPLIEYTPSGTTVWCPFDTEESNFVKLLKHKCNVINSHIWDGKDFFEYEPKQNYDFIISNPPYSLREPILERLFGLQKPFAMLINDAGLFDSKKRFKLLSENKFEIMVFDRRVDYIKPNEPMQKSGVPFKSIFLCSNILPHTFVFKHLPKN